MTTNQHTCDNPSVRAGTLIANQTPIGQLPSESLHRILVIKLRHICDVLLMIPLLSTLRTNYPRALIDELVYDGNGTG